MTAPYSRVCSDHWHGLGNLSFEARAVLAYLLTAPGRNAAQTFVCPVGYIVADTGASDKQVIAALSELEQAGRILRDGDAILIIDGHRHDAISNTNQVAHRVNLWRDGRLPGSNPTFRATCLLVLASALEAALHGLRPPRSDAEITARKEAMLAVAAMEDEARKLDPSATVPEPFPNRSRSVGEPMPNDSQTNPRKTTATTTATTKSTSTITRCGASGGKKRHAYPEDFEAVWRIRPRRHGQDDKFKAFCAWTARIEGGEMTSQEAIEQMGLYRQWCESRGHIGTEFVMRMSSYFGRNEGWREDWAGMLNGGSD